MQILDAWTGADGAGGAEDPLVRMKAAISDLQAAGRLAPPLDWAGAGISKKPGAKQRAALQLLRDLFACARSEAARHGPERCAACLHACMRSRMHACVRACMHACVRARGPAHAHALRPLRTCAACMWQAR
jgi:hypothetical protein